MLVLFDLRCPAASRFVGIALGARKRRRRRRRTTTSIQNLKRARRSSFGIYRPHGM
jgi:hypothetical protein